MRVCWPKVKAIEIVNTISSWGVNFHIFQKRDYLARIRTVGNYVAIANYIRIHNHVFIILLFSAH